MGLVVNALTKFANSNMGTAFYKWTNGEKEQKLLCIGLPLVETAIATTTRVVATEKLKLSRREKNVLQGQNIIPALVGITLGSYLNKKVFELSDNIGKFLDPKKVENINLVKGAIKVATPILSTALLLRLALPVATALFTSKAEDKKEKNKLNIKV